MTTMSTAPRALPETDDRGQLVLVVESDMRMAAALDRALRSAGYRVERSSDGLHALNAFRQLSPDLVLLDLAVPGVDGLGLARCLRDQSGVPMLMFGNGDAVGDRVAGLDAGADDFVCKPFAIEELLARMRAVLRGRALATARAVAGARLGPLAYADVRLDQDTREVWRGERRVELRNKAFELLACFLRHPERVLSRRELLEEAWSYDFLGDSNVIEVTVSHVRQALEAGGEARLIHTVRPVGYILRTSREAGPCSRLAQDAGVVAQEAVTDLPRTDPQDTPAPGRQS